MEVNKIIEINKSLPSNIILSKKKFFLLATHNSSVLWQGRQLAHLNLHLSNVFILNNKHSIVAESRR
jgi:hypothetical protein